MTTAHRATFFAAVGNEGNKLMNPSRQYSSKDLPGYTEMKLRGQGQVNIRLFFEKMLTENREIRKNLIDWTSNRSLFRMSLKQRRIRRTRIPIISICVRKNQLFLIRPFLAFSAILDHRILSNTKLASITAGGRNYQKMLKIGDGGA